MVVLARLVERMAVRKTIAVFGLAKISVCKEWFAYQQFLCGNRVIGTYTSAGNARFESGPSDAGPGIDIIPATA